MRGREILLGVCGGVAAYKTADLCSKLVQAGAGVTVVMTRGAGSFVGATTFEALTNRPVYTEMYAPKEHPRGEHIGLAERSELFVVAPATAHFLAKAALGLADDLLSTLVLTCECPTLFAPAMNTAMWEKPSVQRNVATLREDGHGLVGPGEGWLSCGRVGAGRMAEPEALFAAIAAALTPVGGREEEE
ncbi:flavoprotein [Alienimonas californiensis]|uniref:Phosphopantothenoylcysteine decarboxylase n=1 Tax=Alienimonas californiensis TaxID=2527989 RepID=A0A517PEQ1_9PLAN|nr:flavoprotein [Alienimonas californiensis]QDT17845.1 Phosphopantothenoylcysteine decarboxylase [Alienimonas californiensis]